MICSKCGKEYTERVNYCCQCGTGMGLLPTASKKLMRSRRDRKFAGVCGGFAEYLDLDSTLVRLIWLLMALFVGWGVLGYIVAWIVMPEEPLEEKASSTAAATAGPGPTPQPAATR